MKPTEARAAWVAALRSGKYQQTTGKLSDGESYCCLGVACRVAIEHGVQLEERIVDDGQRRVFFNGEPDVLPVPVRKWLRLSDIDGMYQSEEDSTSLAEQNDAGKTFDEIADLIESKPKGLFK